MSEHCPLGKTCCSSGILEQGNGVARIGHFSTVAFSCPEHFFPAQYPLIIGDVGDAALPPGLERLKPVERESQTIRNAGYNIGLDFQTFTQRCKLVPEDIKCESETWGLHQ